MSLRCLSVRNPWAWAICANAKTYENRTWSTDHRGLIAIHAGVNKQACKHFKSEDRRFDASLFEFGAIIGLADIIDVVPYGPDVDSNPWATGPFCWQLSNGRFLKSPIALKGKLNLFSLSEKVTEEVLSQPTDLMQSDQMYETLDVIKPPLAQTENYFELARHWLENGDIQASHEAIDHAIRHDAEWATAHHFKAWLACDAGETEKAIDLFTRAIELDPSFADAYENRGRLYYEREDNEKAWSDFQAAMEAGNCSAMAFVGSAAILLDDSKYDEAIELCNEVLEIDPNNIFAKMRRAEANLGKREYSTCIEEMNAVLEIAPDCIDALYIRGDARIASGENKQGKIDHQEAERLQDVFESQ